MPLESVKRLRWEGRDGEIGIDGAVLKRKAWGEISARDSSCQVCGVLENRPRKHNK